jgi:hypothetical protein
LVFGARRRAIMNLEATRMLFAMYPVKPIPPMIRFFLIELFDYDAQSAVDVCVCDNI